MSISWNSDEQSKCGKVKFKNQLFNYILSPISPVEIKMSEQNVELKPFE